MELIGAGEVEQEIDGWEPEIGNRQVEIMGRLVGIRRQRAGNRFVQVGPRIWRTALLLFGI